MKKKNYLAVFLMLCVLLLALPIVAALPDDNEVDALPCLKYGHQWVSTGDIVYYEYEMIDNETCRGYIAYPQACSVCNRYGRIETTDYVDFSHSCSSSAIVSAECDGDIQTHYKTCDQCGNVYPEEYDCPGPWHYPGSCMCLPV